MLIVFVSLLEVQDAVPEDFLRLISTNTMSPKLALQEKPRFYLITLHLLNCLLREFDLDD